MNSLTFLFLMFCRWNITIYTRKNFPNSLLDEIVEIQKARICCDLKVVFDFGDLWIHRSALLLSGKSVWWASLLKESCSDVDILPVVTQVEVDKFILTIYGQSIVTGDKYSSDAETFHGFSDAEILAAGGTIRDPTPSLYPPRYAPLQWPPSNSHPGDLGSEERQILHVNSLPGQGQPVKPPSSYKTENLPQKNTLCQEKNSFLNFHWRLGIVFIMSVYCIMVTKCHKVTC